MSCDQATKAYCERAGAVVAPAFGGDAGGASGALLQIHELATTRAAEARGGRRGANDARSRIAALQAKAGDEQARQATIAVFRDMQALGISLPAHSEPDPAIGFALPKDDAQHGWLAVRETIAAARLGLPLPALAHEVRAGIIATGDATTALITRHAVEQAPELVAVANNDDGPIGDRARTALDLAARHLGDRSRGTRDTRRKAIQQVLSGDAAAATTAIDAYVAASEDRPWRDLDAEEAAANYADSRATGGKRHDLDARSLAFKLCQAARVSRCSHCQRFIALSGAHDCPGVNGQNPAELVAGRAPADPDIPIADAQRAQLEEQGIAAGQDARGTYIVVSDKAFQRLGVAPHSDPQLVRLEYGAYIYDAFTPGGRRYRPCAPWRAMLVEQVAQRPALLAFAELGLESQSDGLLPAALLPIATQVQHEQDAPDELRALAIRLRAIADHGDPGALPWAAQAFARAAVLAARGQEIPTPPPTPPASLLEPTRIAARGLVAADPGIVDEANGVTPAPAELDRTERLNQSRATVAFFDAAATDPVMAPVVASWRETTKREGEDSPRGRASHRALAAMICEAAGLSICDRCGHYISPAKPHICPPEAAR